MGTALAEKWAKALKVSTYTAAENCQISLRPWLWLQSDRKPTKLSKWWPALDVRLSPEPESDDRGGRDTKSFGRCCWFLIMWRMGGHPTNYLPPAALDFNLKPNKMYWNRETYAQIKELCFQPPLWFLIMWWMGGPATWIQPPQIDMPTFKDFNWKPKKVERHTMTTILIE